MIRTEDTLNQVVLLEKEVLKFTVQTIENRLIGVATVLYSKQLVLETEETRSSKFHTS